MKYLIIFYRPSTAFDECTGEQSEITGFWSWYDFDMRVDMEGNPHIVMSMVAESENYFHLFDVFQNYEIEAENRAKLKDFLSLNNILNPLI